jgi:hypothetical protein
MIVVYSAVVILFLLFGLISLVGLIAKPEQISSSR